MDKPQQLRVAVTGASGFIGRHLVKAILEQGWTVRAFARDPARLDIDHPALEKVEWDISDAHDLSQKLSGVDLIYHLAAHVPSDFNEPDEAAACFSVNCLGTLTVLMAAEAAQVPRLVHFSSANAYRRTGDGLPEAEPLYPSRRAPYYLASKVAGETIADHWRLTGRIGCAILRLSSVYGPGMPKKSFIHLCADRLWRHQRVELHNGGRSRADFVHVEDVVTAAVRAASPDIDGHFNIGSGDAPELIEVAPQIALCLGAGEDLLHVLPANANASLGFGSLDISRARREMDYDPLPIHAGISRFCAEAFPDSVASAAAAGHPSTDQRVSRSQPHRNKSRRKSKRRNERCAFQAEHQLT